MCTYGLGLQIPGCLTCNHKHSSLALRINQLRRRGNRGDGGSMADILNATHTVTIKSPACSLLRYQPCECCQEVPTRGMHSQLVSPVHRFYNQFLPNSPPQVLAATPLNNRAQTGSHTIDNLAAYSTLNFGIHVTYPSLGVDYTLYSGNPSNNQDSSVHVKVTEVPGGGYRIAFEDRLANQPDRPEAPQLPKDFNDAVFTVTGGITV